MPRETKKVLNLRQEAEGTIVNKPSSVKTPKQKKAKALSEGPEQDFLLTHKEIASQSGWQNFDRPQGKKINEKYFKYLFFVSLAAVIFVVFYFVFFHKDNSKNQNISVEPTWYAIKLANGEMYYGEVDDVKADPIMIKNVYYNYDQINNSENEKPNEETGNLRLVKRGKETHGPDGSMGIIRSQVVFLEPLKKESKVLQAILDYENK